MHENNKHEPNLTTKDFLSQNLSTNWIVQYPQVERRSISKEYLLVKTIVKVIIIHKHCSMLI